MIERGEAGDGSLEPGIASGEEFVIANTNLFLKYYYDANPEELDPGHPSRKRKEADVPEQAGDADEAAADGAEPGCNRREKDRSPVFLYLDRCLDTSRSHCSMRSCGPRTRARRCRGRNAAVREQRRQWQGGVQGKGQWVLAAAAGVRMTMAPGSE